jgi:hypothetical protein
MWGESSWLLKGVTNYWTSVNGGSNTNVLDAGVEVFGCMLPLLLSRFERGHWEWRRSMTTLTTHSCGALFSLMYYINAYLRHPFAGIFPLHGTPQVLECPSLLQDIYIRLADGPQRNLIRRLMDLRRLTIGSQFVLLDNTDRAFLLWMSIVEPNDNLGVLGQMASELTTTTNGEEEDAGGTQELVVCLTSCFHSC